MTILVSVIVIFWNTLKAWLWSQQEFHLGSKGSIKEESKEIKTLFSRKAKPKPKINADFCLEDVTSEQYVCLSECVCEWVRESGRMSK